MAGGWFNLEGGKSVLPETQFFEGDSAFKSFGLSKKTRLYGFVAWCVFDDARPFRRTHSFDGLWLLVVVWPLASF